MKLDNVRLLVRNFDKCFRFYAETLQLKLNWGKLGGDYASFDVGKYFGLSLYKSDLMASALGNADLDYPSTARDKVAVIFKVDDVDLHYNNLKDRGAEFLKAPQNMTGWGIRVAHFRDPEGNLIEIHSDLPKENWDKDLQEDAEEYGL
ncbi:MAG: VOC family protein [Bacteroidales bacterium]